MVYDRRKKQSEATKQASRNGVMRIEIVVLPHFYDRIDEEAKKTGRSARRWIAEKIAEMLAEPTDQVLPPYRGTGRPRKNRSPT